MGIAFGPDVTKRWCDLNKVTGILRSHEVRQGRKMDDLFFFVTHTDYIQAVMPLNITGYVQRYAVLYIRYPISFPHKRSQVFSAPNYVDQGGNKGAFVCPSLNPFTSY